MKEIIFNWMLDLRKEKISPFERAKVINKYLEEHKLSQRELSKQIGISHSTLQDWCMWSRLTKDRYNELKDSGYNDKSIYRLLRNNKVDVSKLKNDFDVFLMDTNTKIKEFTKLKVKTEHTENLISELTNNLNRLLIKKR